MLGWPRQSVPVMQPAVRGPRNAQTARRTGTEGLEPLGAPPRLRNPPRKCLHGGQGRKPHDRDEFDVLRMIATQEVDAREAVDSARHDAFEDLRAQELLVGIRVLVTRPPMRQDVLLR